MYSRKPGLSAKEQEIGAYLVSENQGIIIIACSVLFLVSIWVWMKPTISTKVNVPISGGGARIAEYSNRRDSPRQIMTKASLEVLRKQKFVFISRNTFLS